MATILYAEDERDIRELFAIVLRQRGHTVLEATNGAQAVQLAREEAIDLVLLDVRMPLMTGYDAARRIFETCPTLPIVFLSVKDLPQDIRKAFDCGAMVVDYLVKPIDIAHFEKRLQQVLEQCHIEGPAVVREQSLRHLVPVY